MTPTSAGIEENLSYRRKTSCVSQDSESTTIEKSEIYKFEKLFHANYSRLLAVAFYFMKSQVQAEEVVSRVFLKFWTDRKKIKINSSPAAYLNTAVRNKCVDLLRITSRSTDYDPDPFLNDSVSKLASPLEELVSIELQNKIETAIEQLPEDRKRVFRLSRDNGLKYREIANHLKISIKTVETQMSRALKQLRKELQEYLTYE